MTGVQTCALPISSYDLEIIKAVRKIFVDDNVDPNPPYDLSIESYVSDRIYLSETTQQQATFPQITLDFFIGQGNGDLPVEHGELRISAWYNMDAQSSRTLVRRCMARISSLLDRKPNILNIANTSIDVRLIDKFSSIVLPEYDRKLIRGLVIFDVTYKNLRS